MTLQPCAKWTNDCQGKKDFDGRLVSISTRYWPSGGGVHVLQGDEFQLCTDPAIRPAAVASIVLNFGEPDDNGYGDEHTLMEQRFEAATEKAVKAQVEEWVTRKVNEIATVLQEHFASHPGEVAMSQPKKYTHVFVGFVEDKPFVYRNLDYPGVKQADLFLSRSAARRCYEDVREFVLVPVKKKRSPR